jgi:hypothetical protein
VFVTVESTRGGAFPIFFVPTRKQEDTDVVVSRKVERKFGRPVKARAEAQVARSTALRSWMSSRTSGGGAPPRGTDKCMPFSRPKNDIPQNFGNARIY